MLPLTRGAMERIRDAEHYRALERTYHHPTFVQSLPHPGRERRVRDGHQLIVVSDSGLIIGVSTLGEHEIAVEDVPDLAPMRRSRGGGGSRLPTDYRELKARLTALGCVVEPTANHVRVTAPDGSPLPGLPTTTSDWRSLANVVSQYRRYGYDLRRPKGGQ